MFDRITRTLAHCRAAHETNEQLSRLSDAQLRDIGLTREEIPEVVRRAGNFN